MKKILFTVFSILFGFLGITFADLDITNYKILGDIQNDGTVGVKEYIDVFFYDKMHGIERDFIDHYTSQDMMFWTFISNIAVPGHNYQIFDNYDGQTVRIGDADIYVEGKESYEIDYDVYGLIRNFSGMGYSELYRDIIGYERSNDIDNVQIELTLPKAYTGFSKDDFLISAGYTDRYSIDDFLGEVTRDENKIYITYNHKLSPYNGITLAVKFPNGYFDFDHEKQESLLAWYINDFNIENYKIYGKIDKSGNIAFQNEIKLEVLNEDPRVRGRLPYNYKIDGHNYLVILSDIVVNGVKLSDKKSEYDTTTTERSVEISGDFQKNDTITSSYSIYGLIRPFSGDFSDWTHNLYYTSGDFDEWTYRLYLQLPLLDLNSKIKNIRLNLEVPGDCSKIYTEDIYVDLGDGFIGTNEFNEKYGHVWCKSDGKLALTYSGEISKYSSMILSINFVKGTFDLDEELLGALSIIGDGKFYYSDKTNWQSIALAVLMIVLGGGFKKLMDKRYSTKSRMNRKCVIQYDPPKGVDAPEAGVLVDDRLDGKDITSIIYQRAANHYIKIYTESENTKEFYIKKLKDLPTDSKSYQINLFNSLFENGSEFHFGENSDKFYKYMKTANSGLTSYINSQKWYTGGFSSGLGYFFKHQTRSLIIWALIGLIILYFAIVTALTDSLVFTSNWVIFVFVGLLIFVISCYRNYEKEVNTSKGQEVRDHCVGYKEFLVKVDKEKLETLLKQDPLYLEKVLPYAVVFGIYSQFIKKITPEVLEQIDRFEGDIDDLRKSISYINNFAIPFSLPSSSSSGGYSSSGGFSSGSSFGGGFSSGGGGGGGGGGGR